MNNQIENRLVLFLTVLTVLGCICTYIFCSKLEKHMQQISADMLTDLLKIKQAQEYIILNQAEVNKSCIAVNEYIVGQYEKKGK